MRKKIKLQLGDKRDSFNGNIKKPYYLFLEMGEKQFVFSNKVKAKKWLVTFENKLNSLTKELIHSVPKLYEYNVKLSLYMTFPEQKRFRNNLDYSIERYWLLYNSDYISSISREIYNIISEIEFQLKFYDKLLSKNSRNQNMLNEVKVEIKHLKYLKNDFDALFDVDKNLISLADKQSKKIYTSDSSEKYLRIA
ncbi:hypothetical protein [Polaribacter marinivivus]|uniref:PH domain-containing protein n=1 Tax=Polaribacter marinivivus TaxID=1524260 RepID=A0ABV8RBG2_9FLAO